MVAASAVSVCKVNMVTVQTQLLETGNEWNITQGEFCTGIEVLVTCCGERSVL